MRSGSGKNQDLPGQQATALRHSIDIVNLSKSFQRSTNNRADYTTLKSLFLSLSFGKSDKHGTVTHAIRDLTMRVPAGASMGIIGRNGSGKSTLLKLITGIYKPSQGSVQVNGRVAALIELGAGFHPDFTGRENLFLGGVLHGLSKDEIKSVFDEIVEFAELGHVIDDPVRTYSSGMFMRLGFSLAIHTNPDVLLIDEVLAVGDAAFVSKCKERISQLRRDGKTLLLVSHDLDAVERWCDEAIWLHRGRVEDRGDPRRVIDAYRLFVEKGEEDELLDKQSEVSGQRLDDVDVPENRLTQQHQDDETARWGSREVEITAVRVLDSSGTAHLLFHPEDSVQIEFDYKVHQQVSEIIFGIGLHRTDGIQIHGSNTDIEGVDLSSPGNAGTVRYKIERLGLLEGNYTIDVAVHRQDGYAFDYHQGAVQFGVRSSLKQVGVFVPQHSWELSTTQGTVVGLPTNRSHLNEEKERVGRS